MAKKGKFDYILLETTGLADPGNLAPLFWMDAGLGSSLFLDGIVTLVDAKNILRSLDEPDPAVQAGDHGHADAHGPLMTTAHVQISHADVIVINKADLVDTNELARVRARIESINGLARIHVTAQSTLPQLDGVVLDLHAYETAEAVERAVRHSHHSHLDPVRGAPPSPAFHGRVLLTGQTISTHAIDLGILSPAQLTQLDAWLRSVLWDGQLPDPAGGPPRGGLDDPANFEIHRLKGRLLLEDGSVKVVQGVRELFEVFDPPASSPAEEAAAGDDEPMPPPASSKLILIGRRLGEFGFKESLLGVLGRHR